MKLKEIANRIHAHLKRFESDPKINARKDKRNIVPYWNSNAFDSGSRVGVSYVSFQGTSFLTKPQAIEYLEWLDAGNVGTHYVMQARDRKDGAA